MSLVINVTPSLTTAAGSVLTVANWRELGVEHGAFCLAALCIRPGPQILLSFESLRHYCAWPGKIVLNMVALWAAKTASGDFKLRSPYDGSYFTISKKEVSGMLQHLQPDYVVFPDNQSLSDFSQEPTPWLSLIVGSYGECSYIIDDCPQSIPHVVSSGQSGVMWIETDRPAQDGLHGIGYCVDRNINLLEKVYREDFTALEAACTCPTCQQRLTKAYIHHLLQHTPLLAQRFLIAHNVAQYKKINSSPACFA